MLGGRTGRPERGGSGVVRWAKSAVVFLGLYQGAVPLVARGIFGRDQRLAPATWLTSPWWWLACLAIVAVGIGLLAALESSGKRSDLVALRRLDGRERIMPSR